MALLHLVRQTSRALAATAQLAVAGLHRSTHLHRSTDQVSSFHKTRLDRSRKPKKRDNDSQKGTEPAQYGSKDRSTSTGTVDHQNDEEGAQVILVSSTEHTKVQDDIHTADTQKSEVGDKTEYGNKEIDEEGDEGQLSQEGGEEQDEDDEDPLDGFSDVISGLDLWKLQQAAAVVRLYRNSSGAPDASSLDDLSNISCDIHPVPKCGSYNLAYLVTFGDGVKWIARVPGHGYSGRWGELDQAKMKSEYQTMRYIRANTSIPLPEVYHFDTTCDIAGAPFAFISLVEGTSLAELWRDEMSEPERMYVLGSIAKCMSQLYTLSFERIGMLQFDEQGSVCDVRQAINLESLNFDFWHITQAHGPYSTFVDSLWDRLDEDEDISARQRANLPILRRALQSIPDFLKTEREFPLNFADFNAQNIYVDSEYRITGFIDWDGVKTDSATAGSARYPSWITRDWDPIMYEWDEDVPEDEQNEESPATLSRYRQHYASELSKCMAGVESYDPRMTTLSHIFEAIRIALCSQLSRSDIMTKLLDHAFSGKPPFTKFEYVNDFIDGKRAKKDQMIEAAFAKMWHAEWEESILSIIDDDDSQRLGTSETSGTSGTLSASTEGLRVDQIGIDTGDIESENSSVATDELLQDKLEVQESPIAAEVEPKQQGVDEQLQNSATYERHEDQVEMKDGRVEGLTNEVGGQDIKMERPEPEVKEQDREVGEQDVLVNASETHEVECDLQHQNRKGDNQSEQRRRSATEDAPHDSQQHKHRRSLKSFSKFYRQGRKTSTVCTITGAARTIIGVFKKQIHQHKLA